MELLLVIIVLALVFDYINGFHDAANSIATVVSTKVLTPLQAVLWAGFFNFVAFFIFKDHAVANTISKTVHTEFITLPVIFAGLIAAIAWNLLTWWYGIPSSSSHTLIGGFAGAALAHALATTDGFTLTDVIESDKVTSLEKLGDLVNVNDIEIVDTKLAALDFVQDQVEVFGHVRVQGNAKLTSLSPLRASRYTGTVSEEFVPFYVIDNNAELTTIGGLKYLTESTDQLTFTNNPKLTSIELPELTKVTGTGTFQVTGNGITTLTVSSLATVTSIDISQNPQLTNVSGLRVTRITGGIQFKNNPKLSSIGSMGSLTHIGGNLVVDDNDALSDLGGLTSSMQKVVGSVTVTGNQTLSNLGQLSRLSQGINGTVSVMNNPVLGYCAAWELDRCVASGAVTNTGNGNTQTNCPHWCP